MPVLDPVAVTAAERLDAAAALLARGDVAECEAVVRDVLDGEPAHLGALALLGAVALTRRDGEAARRILAAVVSADPSRPEIVANLALAHQMCGDDEAALAAAEHASALAPREARHRILLGQLRLERGEVDAAAGEAEAALALAPDDAEGLVFAAAVALARADKAVARRLLTRATALAPGHAEAQINLSELLAAGGEGAAALAAAERAQLAAPADLRARLCLARRLAETGDLDRAEAAVKRVLAVGAESIEPNELWSRIALARGAVEKAIGSLAELARRRGGDPPALLALARLLRAAGRGEQALTIAADLAARSEPPRGTVALHRDLSLALGRFDAAWPASGSADDEAASLAGVIAIGGSDPAETLIALAAAEHLAARRGAPLPLYGGDVLVALLSDDTRLEVTDAVPPPGAVVAALPAVPELAGGAPWPVRAPRLDPLRAQAWAAALDGLARPWIGIVWSDGVAGPPLAALAAALDAALAGAGTVVALTGGEARRALAAFPAILDGGRHVVDFVDVAAAVAGLDAVIAPDGAVLALAGALGRPAAAVLPPGHGWAWHAGADGRATWFPSVTVLRQARPGIDAAAWVEPLAGLAGFVTALGVEKA